MRMTVLGSGGWIPTSSRQTSCYLITAGTEALILDAGTGLGALHIDPSLLDGVDTVTVALSHFHLDHVTGLAFVSGRALGGRELTIAGPGSLSYGRPTRTIVEAQLLAAPLQTTSPLASARWAELGWDTVSFAGHEVQIWEQTRHPLPSAGFRIGGSVAYCTDTEFDPQTIRQVAGVSTLLHEAWEPVNAERGHTSGDEAGVIAAESGVSRLVLTHSHPLPDVAEHTQTAAQARFAAVTTATDGAVLDL
ncbi:MBL fold metallo-hydrolase [Mycobacterium cookii]|uniref:MBL fold metallo-hydrolase n=1 Tax=Mycobacterium cookii TaxID=1775 RepID=A0A7I7KWY8_9MYCO|nr:MBL fold metallo-hydrolase [Mycobacterium cookii]MCV7330815.1 MBL fold metallo-hydrolase [Mycobacterium cookii]BBX46590.1 MBL fold metallo-hydrolase [Mycobacterium cookii]